MAQQFEKECKGMLHKSFPHNLGSPIYNYIELQNILKSYCKKVKKPEFDLSDYQKDILKKKIHTEKMF